MNCLGERTIEIQWKKQKEYPAHEKLMYDKGGTINMKKRWNVNDVTKKFNSPYGEK